MIDFSDALGEEEIAEYDPLSGKPVVWGKRVLRHLCERDFDHLKMQHEVVAVQEMDTVYFVVSRKIEWSTLVEKQGQPLQVGTGPRGGFKWVRMTDDTVWGHKSFRVEALRWLKNYPRYRIKCDKDGNSLRPPRRTLGRAAGGNSRKKR